MVSSSFSTAAKGDGGGSGDVKEGETLVAIGNR